MLFRMLIGAMFTLLLTPIAALAQTIETEDGQTLQLVPVANPAAVIMQDLSDDYGMIDYDTQHAQDNPRRDFMVAYERFDDAPPIGPLFVEMRLVLFDDQPQSFIDSEMAEYLRIGAPELTSIAAPSGLETFRWFTVDDPLQGLTGFATLFPTFNGFASIAALGDESEFTIDDLVTITRAAARRLGV